MANNTVTLVKNTDGYVAEVHRELTKQKPYRVNVQLPFGSDPTKVKELPVGINGHWFHIKYGQWTEVPEEVYLILVRGGHIRPMGEEHEAEAPRQDAMVSTRLADNVKELL